MITSGTAFAATTISSLSDQIFKKNQSPTQIYDITITEDRETAYIIAGAIKITIPETLKMIFDSERTAVNILIHGSAVDTGKVLQNPDVTFENGDKTLVIPIEADFAIGEEIVITRVYAEGFHESPSNSDHLILQINDDTTQYIDSKDINIETSAYLDTYEPDRPTNLTLQNDANGVKITWTDPTDLDLSTIHILRGKNEFPVSGTPYMEIGPGVEEYIDSDVAVGDTVKYMLRATDGINFSALTAEVSIVVGEPPTPVEELPAPTEEETTAPQTEEATYCSPEYIPVCGIDNITYANECVATKKNIEVSYEGECEGVAEETSVSFSDISGHWAQAEIESLTERGIIEGQSEGIFNPDGNLNRAEAATLIYRIMGGETPGTPEENPFTDVSKDAWYAPYISNLKEIGLVNGKTPTTYSPSEFINRAEFLQLAMNLHHYYPANVIQIAQEITTFFHDMDASSWYAQTVTEAYGKGFINGSACGEYACFNPDKEISRAEAVKILYKIFPIED
ncbi:MAG: S-layer homology domain-containing protein [bacterium]